ncbi:MAG: heavy metal translocating P-type ATPase, partial [Candidatus Hydrogenedentes bacterium]|nr:heavy metal translocating P-type ATPase [Candidatus Hydrogenedentota bacterium]
MPPDPRHASPESSGAPVRHTELALTLATLVLLFVTLLGGWLGMNPGLLLALHVTAYVTGGWWATLETVPRLFKGELDVDFLMLVAALGAATIGHWTEGIILLFLFSLSNTLQSYALDRSRRAVNSLMKKRPTEATVLREGQEVLVPIEALQIRDIVLLRPGQMAPTDGTVRVGFSDMDESSITGESRPASKAPGDIIFAGAINGTGALEFEVTRLSQDSTLARIVRMIESAQAQKAHTQRVLERFETYYAWTILSATGLLILAPLALGAAFDPTFYRAMTLLVVASPCALVISTPAAILSAIARGARQGVLFKGGVYLEKMAEVRVVVFDKTGTLTTGKPGLTDVVLARSAPPGFTEADLLGYAAALESRSEHLLAKEIVAAATKRGLSLPPMDNFVALPGRGVHATLAGYQVWIGGNRMFEEHGEQIPEDLVAAKERLEQEGKSVLILHRELERVQNVGVHEAQGGWLGLIGMADTMRSDVPETVRALKRLGIERVVMLTGDNEIVAAAIAGQAGIDAY